MDFCNTIRNQETTEDLENVLKLYGWMKLGNRKVFYLFCIINVLLCQQTEGYSRCFWDYIEEMFDPNTRNKSKELTVSLKLDTPDTCTDEQIRLHMRKEHVHRLQHIWKRNKLYRNAWDRYLKSCTLPNKTSDQIKPPFLDFIRDSLEYLISMSFQFIIPVIALILWQTWQNKRMNDNDPANRQEILEDFKKGLQDVVNSQVQAGAELRARVDEMSNVLMPMTDSMVSMHSKEEIIQFLEETVKEIEKSERATPDIMQVFTPAFLNNLAEYIVSDPAFNRNLTLVTADNLIKLAESNRCTRPLIQNKDSTIGLDFTIKVKYNDE